MSIMVDDPAYPFRGQNYCHMMSTLTNRAQAEQELHDFAARLGLKRQYFQQSLRHPHYDLSPSKRRLAIQMGATVVSSKAMVLLNPFNAELWKGADTFCTHCYWWGHHSKRHQNLFEEWLCPWCGRGDFNAIAWNDQYTPPVVSDNEQEKDD